MRICFRLPVCAGFTAALLCAAGPAAQPPAVTSVVRTDSRTGKLVRTVVVHNPAVLVAAVDSVAARHALPPELVQSLVKTESNYNPNALSPKGARGLMQLVPATARRFGVDDPSNPVANLEGGAKYLRYLLDLYRGDESLALAAYNSGEQSVSRYGGIPPFPETRKYVVEIQNRVAQKQKASTGARKSGAPAPSASEPSSGNHVIEIAQPDGTVRYVSRQDPL